MKNNDIISYPDIKGGYDGLDIFSVTTPNTTVFIHSGDKQIATITSDTNMNVSCRYDKVTFNKIDHQGYKIVYDPADRGTDDPDLYTLFINGEIFSIYFDRYASFSIKCCHSYCTYDLLGKELDGKRPLPCDNGLVVLEWMIYRTRDCYMSFIHFIESQPYDNNHTSFLPSMSTVSLE